MNTSESSQDLKLRELCQKLKNKLDQFKQELHRSTQELHVQEALLQERQEEITNLKKLEVSKKLEYEAKIVQVEEVIANLRTSGAEETNQLESELRAKDEDIARLQKEINFCKRKNAIEVKPVNDVLQPETLLLENETLKEKCLELQMKIEGIHLKRQEVLVSTQECEAYLTADKTILEVKNEQIAEQNNLIEQLKQDLQKAKESLQVLKSNPLPDGSRGNSMFAQIEDRRVKLEEIANKMGSNYVHLEREYHQQEKCILKLRGEYSDLITKIEKQLLEAPTKIDREEESLRNEIELEKASLLAARASLAEIPKLITTIPEADRTKGEFLYYQNVIDSNNEKVSKLEEKLLDLSTYLCEQAVNFSETHRELKMLEVKKLKLQHEIDEAEEKDDLKEKKEICKRYTMNWN